jgi:hypothetical protein
MEKQRFMDIDCIELKNETLSVLVAQSVGPRILSLRHHGGENILAELPDLVAECVGVGPFHFYGGHRLWHAPEDTSRTYMPDSEPVELTSIEQGVRLVQSIEARTGIQKSMQITLPGKQPQVTIQHQLTNHGLWPVELAAWGITQLKPGGVAILPQSVVWTDKLPNRSLVLWPYDDMSSPNIHWRKDRIELQTPYMEGAFKLGFPNPRGWLAYWRQGTLFIKRAAYFAQETYCDFGCSSECYMNDLFIELETLSPMRKLEPGGSIVHVETWEYHQGIEFPESNTAFLTLADKLGLE